MSKCKSFLVHAQVTRKACNGRKSDGRNKQTVGGRGLKSLLRIWDEMSAVRVNCQRFSGSSACSARKSAWWHWKWSFSALVTVEDCWQAHQWCGHKDGAGMWATHTAFWTDWSRWMRMAAVKCKWKIQRSPVSKQCWLSAHCEIFAHVILHCTHCWFCTFTVEYLQFSWVYFDQC